MITQKKTFRSGRPATVPFFVKTAGEKISGTMDIFIFPITTAFWVCRSSPWHSERFPLITPVTAFISMILQVPPLLSVIMMNCTVPMYSLKTDRNQPGKSSLVLSPSIPMIMIITMKFILFLPLRIKTPFKSFLLLLPGETAGMPDIIRQIFPDL